MIEPIHSKHSVTEKMRLADFPPSELYEAVMAYYYTQIHEIITDLWAHYRESLQVIAALQTSENKLEKAMQAEEQALLRAQHERG